MKIRIPDLNGEEEYIENKQSFVLIGANGAGKTRMSIWIDENNPDIDIHRISAQKSLNMPGMVRPGEISVAEENFLYGMTYTDKNWLKVHGKKNNRWGEHPETHLLNDFSQLMEYLMTENYEKSIEYREKHKEGDDSFDNETRLEKIKSIWENVIIHRNLKICAGKIEVSEINLEQEVHNYNGSEMSDGERAIFYYIAEVLCAKEHSLIIIDEPENHLHKSILVRLWDAIENARPDCMFLYITHNVEFAVSRLNTQVIWVKNMQSNSVWEYELLEDKHFSDDLLLEILGNRQKVLLIEGTRDQSIDRKLYSKIYPEYNIIPLASCSVVIQTTKAYNSITNLHYVEVKGIVDRDRRSEGEILSLRGHNICVPEVAEVESLFLLPEVISIVAEKQDKEEVEQIINDVKTKTIEFLHNHLAEQALLFTKQKCQNMLNQICNESVATIDEYNGKITSLPQTMNVNNIYNEMLVELQKIVDESDFSAALKVVNNKGLLPYTNLSNVFGWTKAYYIDYVIRLTGINDDYGIRLREIFSSYISLN